MVRVRASVFAQFQLRDCPLQVSPQKRRKAERDAGGYHVSGLVDVLRDPAALVGEGSRLGELSTPGVTPRDPHPRAHREEYRLAEPLPCLVPAERLDVRPQRAHRASVVAQLVEGAPER